MAGRGPAPKDPDKRARRNKDSTGLALRVLPAMPSTQPDLPTFSIEADGELVEFVWPAQTLEWWAMWRDSSLSDEYAATDWAELAITAQYHAAIWRGDLKAGTEYRLRVSKFGATPEDRARLRITFAAADQAEAPRTSSATGSSRDRYNGLRAAE
jgi:hypothetical protein